MLLFFAKFYFYGNICFSGRILCDVTEKPFTFESDLQHVIEIEFSPNLIIDPALAGSFKSSKSQENRKEHKISIKSV